MEKFTHNDEDSLLASYEESSSSSEEEEDEPTGDIRDFPDLHKEFNQRGDAILKTMVPDPPLVIGNNDDADWLLYLFYYAVQYVLVHCKMDGDIPKPNPFHFKKENDQVFGDKVYYMHLCSCYNKLMEKVTIMGEQMYNAMESGIKDTLRQQGVRDVKMHPMCYILESIKKHKELHSKRLKLDPNTQINQQVPSMIKNKITKNCVTYETYDPNNVDHKRWKQLIFNPLPSDYNNDNINPQEGEESHRYAIEVAKLQGKWNIPEPFAFVVTPNWDKQFRILHTIYHFREYMYMYIANSIEENDWETIRKIENWQDAWKFIMGEYAEFIPLGRDNVKGNKASVVVHTIRKLPKEKKNVPPIVFRMIELRDNLEAATRFPK